MKNGDPWPFEIQKCSPAALEREEFFIIGLPSGGLPSFMDLSSLFYFSFLSSFVKSFASFALLIYRKLFMDK